jgi:hypothetical protein
VDTSLHQQASNVIRALWRAQKLFGGGEQPTPSPAFVTPANLEDTVGCGRF